MKRKEIWEAYMAAEPHTEAVGRDKCVASVICVSEAQQLVIGVWGKDGREPKGVYYMAPGGGHFVSRNGVEWRAKKLDALIGERYWYGCGKILLDCEECGNIIHKWLVDHFYDLIRYSGGDPLYLLDRVETRMGYDRAQETRGRRLKRITAWANGCPDLPGDFDAFLRRVAFGDRHYLYYDKDKRAYGCSACGGVFGELAKGAHYTPAVKQWRRGMTVNCPGCGVVASVVKGGVESADEWERVMLVQRYHDRKDENEVCAVARHFDVKMHYEVGFERLTVWPSVIIKLPMRVAAEHGDVYYVESYNNGKTEWSDKNPFYQKTGECYCYPDVTALKGTVYDGMGLEVAAEKGWKIDYNNLMHYKHGDPRVEYLIKGGLYGLVRDFANGRSLDGWLRRVEGNKPTMQALLGLDGQGVQRLRKLGGGCVALDWMRLRTDLIWPTVKVSDEVLRTVQEWCMTTLDAAVILKYLTPEQIVNYINKQRAYYRDGRKRMYEPSTVRITWRDTIEMEERLKLDMSKDQNIRPKNLFARHDELVAIINAEKDRVRDEEAEAQFPQVKPTCARIRGIYEWSDGEHAVIVPQGVADIQREGRLLMHCVAANERYLDRIADGESYILFLRRCDKQDTPWYTMEVEPGGKIRQLRTTGDREGDDRAEAKAFLRKWARVVHDRCPQDEIHAALVSREKRLSEFAELRIGGNVVRRGVLAGKLLVDVLEADFRELNEPEGEVVENFDVS